MKRETTSETAMPRSRDCGCGKRALKVVRAAGVTEEQMPDEYVRGKHTRATLRALWMWLTGKGVQR